MAAMLEFVFSSARGVLRINMKVLVLLWSLSLSQGAVIVPIKNPDDYGASLQFNNQDSIGNYNFGYNEGHFSGGSFRRESGDAFGNKVGSYGLRDADGRLRIVTYVADANGFRADVRTNEPGVEPQDPASTTINKPVLVAGTNVNPAPVVAAPVAAAPVAIPVRPAPVPIQPAVKIAPPPPPPPPPAVPIAQYANTILPYATPYKGYPSPVAPVYYRNPYADKFIGSPAVQNFVAVSPPGFPLPYGGLRSLPAYQPLGFS